MSVMDAISEVLANTIWINCISQVLCQDLIGLVACLLSFLLNVDNPASSLMFLCLSDS